MSNNNNHPLGEAPWFHVILSTGLGTGFVPVAPETAGALLALLIWIGLYFVLTPTALCITTIALIIITLFLGAWTDEVMEKYWGPDPRTVVIDEYIGTWMAAPAALFCQGPSYIPITLATIGFVLFRIIDIWKPLGCRWVDQNIHGGWGCMLDDVLAGFYALILTLLIRYFGIVEIVHDYFFN
jgi:phosphatidylglycerophosphatase A